MAIETNAAPAAGAAPALPAEGPITLSQAANSLAQDRQEPEKPPRQRAPDGKFARAEQTDPAPQEPDAAAVEEQPPGETPEAETDPAEQPPIDPPRSWTKDEKERFSSLPRETQEYIAERERDREREIRRGQDEVAKQRQAIDAELKAAQQAQQQYAQGLAQLEQQTAKQIMGEFADIKSDEDVRNLATNDPFRFAQYQAALMQYGRIQSANAEAQRQAHERQAHEFKVWADDQDKAFADQFKEFSDPQLGPKARESVVNYLTDKVGVPRDQLGNLWTQPLFRDAKMQRIIYDAARFSAAQEKAKSITAAPKPAPQRPGVSASKGDAQASTIAALEKKLDSAKTVKQQIEAAAALQAAQRAARAA